MIDCLLIGFNDTNFEEYVEMVRSMGSGSGAYKDLSLAFVELDNKPNRSMDVLNRYYFEGNQEHCAPFHNADFLWPVITCLTTYLTRRGFKADYVNLFHLEKEKLIKKLVEDDPLTVAITTTLYVSPQPMLEIISFVRKYNRKTKIVVGGPYISNQAKITDPIQSQKLFKFIGADFYVISQEGEYALAQLLKALKTGSNLEEIDNIAYKKGGLYAINSTSIESNPLEDNLVEYRLFEAEINEFVSTRTAKSCPFTCAFCGFPARAGKYKYTGVELVEKELNALKALGKVTTLTFIDDTFNVPKGRFKEILRMMIRNKYDFKWNCFYRCDHGDEEAIELMGLAGCEGVFLGVESGSDLMLEAMNKSARRKDYLEAIPLLKAAGVSTYASLIIGFPGETFETVQETMDFIEEAKPDFYRAQLWYADPVTPIWEKREEYAITGSAFNWTHKTMDSDTACDLIDRIFLSIRNSIWLPQFGFEQWSIFYLMRKGMTINQIRDFLTLFNAGIKERLISPSTRTISPPLLNSLKISCKFKSGTAPDMSVAEPFSSSCYLDAEDFWTAEFGQVSPPVMLALLREENRVGRGDDPSCKLSISREVFKQSLVKTSSDPVDLLLAACTILISRLSGAEDFSLAACFDSGNDTVALPLRLRPFWDMRLTDFVREVSSKRASSERHRLYGLHIVTNRFRMAVRGSKPPAFSFGFDYTSRTGDNPGKRLEQMLNSYPGVCESLDLIFRVAESDEQLDVHFEHGSGHFNKEVIVALSGYLSAILAEACRNPETLIGEIPLESSGANPDSLVGTHANEAFSF